MKTTPMAGNYPGNPAMSPHAARGTGTRHCVETVERGWEENCLGDELPHYETQGKCLLYATSLSYMLQSTSTWNSDTCAYVSTPLTSSGAQALFVVNSVKLHLTVLNVPY